MNEQASKLSPIETKLRLLSDIELSAAVTNLRFLLDLNLAEVFRRKSETSDGVDDASSP